jgi:hypothetical protein
MNPPVWITPAGFLGTVTERTTAFITLSVEDTATFSLISGDLPVGLSLNSQGIISGTVSSIGGLSKKQFVIRARNSSGITDRTFVMDVQGVDNLSWITPEGWLQIGHGHSYYVINKEYVNFQFEASTGELTIPLSTASNSEVNTLYVSTLTNVDLGQPGVWRGVGGTGIQAGTTLTNVSTVFNQSNQGYAISISLPTTTSITGSIKLFDPLPPGQSLMYYIEDQDGVIPPGLVLNKSGLLSGYVMDKLSFDSRISVGGYDSDQYSEYPYDHGILVDGQYVKQILKYVPKVYQFKVTASDGFDSVKRSFKILIVDPSHLLADTNYNYASGLIGPDAGFLVRPQWLDPVWYGFTSTIGIVY